MTIDFDKEERVYYRLLFPSVTNVRFHLALTILD